MNAHSAGGRESSTSVPTRGSALDVIASASPDHFYLFDLWGRYQYASPAAAQAVGLEQTHFIGRTWRELGFPADVMEQFDRARDSVIATRRQWRGELRCPLGPGARDAAHEYIMTPVFSARGDIQGIVATVRDVTARKQAEDAAQYQAAHDVLTGLPNRVLLQDRFQQSILAARRHRLPLAVLLLDLDDFKRVNDTFGHHIGDQLLHQGCTRWEFRLRTSDTLARVGGDEFVVLLPETDHGGGVQVAQTLLDAAVAPWTIEGKHMVIDVSLGIAVYPGDGEDAAILRKHADDAMYRVKRANGAHRAPPTRESGSEQAITKRNPDPMLI